MRKKFNKFDLTSFDYGIGITSNGDEFIFDKEDYEKIKDICWYKDTTGYYRGQYPNSVKKASLHRIIMNANKTDTIDHINHNLNDNRKSNLRVCTRSQNSRNCIIRSDNESGYTGVWFNKLRKKWEAQICINHQRLFLGYFDTKKEAIKVRLNAEDKYFKEYSYTNSVKQTGGDANGH